MGSAPEHDRQLPKAELRRHWRQRRQQAMAAGAGAALLAAVQRWLAAAPPGAGHLGLYWPLAAEPDLRPLASHHAGPLALPAVEAGPDGARLVYRRWRPGEALVADACAIPAPAPAPPLAPEDLALLLVPALACDATGIRLGYGGGWYDRLRADPAWRRVPARVVLPSACLVERLPADGWDVPFEGWIDERGHHHSLVSKP
ncbi:MAG: 5-formyltetrahydrofolate cyclo-ligase [Cyanobacteriota bacterium]|nr:5-formyltetrahydrofolate cyclo-ligase [Cyanobacteriota bacterium]